MGENTGYKKLIISMTATLKKYHEMLDWTQGTLNLEKYFFSVMEWRFTEEGLPYLEEIKHNLTIQQTPQEKQKIKQLLQTLSNTTSNQATIIHELHQLTGIPSQNLTPTQ